MTINTDLAQKIWYRYCYSRDTGHIDYVKKADICERFFRGEQWCQEDVQALKAALRPHLTINKIISTVGNVMGEQIYNRNEISFRPLNGSPDETAETLRKVFKQISEDNQLDWRRSDMFADGIITSRGFLDVRMDFKDNLQGVVRINNLNPKNVIIDPDGEEYDPDTWNEVITTKWMTADDIATLYNTEDADYLRGKEDNYFPYGYDAVDYHRDRFGKSHLAAFAAQPSLEQSSVLRNVRIIDRQYRKLDRQKHFVDTQTGDTRPVPEGWDKDRIELLLKALPTWRVIPKLVNRIRWTVIAGPCVLHDDWSPYSHFTVVPYFPYFRRGHTIGLVENLVGPQELLNKVSSQELHTVNTTANSGWKVKAGALTNMSLEELEQKGASTGLVLELNEMDGAEKITPNGTPQGLDRISYKAEEHIKTISGIGDSQMGQDREDVAAKAIQAKRQASSTNLAKPLDNLNRSDFLLARCILELVQTYYTEERLVAITHETGAGGTETFPINQAQPDGSILNDLTVGEYGVVITSVPMRETLEDSQFDQAVALKELGLAIPDSVLIDNSRLSNKKDIVKQMQAAQQSPDAQRQAQLADALQQADVAKTQAEAQQKTADAGLKHAKAAKETVAAQKEAATPPGAEEAAGAQAQVMKTQAEIVLDREKFEHEKAIDAERMALEREKAREKARLDAEKAAQDAMNDRIARASQPVA